MSNVRKNWSIITLILAFAAGTVMHEFAPTPVQAAPSASPVIVTNTPLPISGTVGVSSTSNVNITNTTVPISGSVSAAHSGPWSVGITGTVSLAPGASVRDADNPALKSGQMSNSCTLGGGGCNW